MSTLAPAAPAATRTAVNDPRTAAFLHPDGPEVFHAVATPTALWQPDPFDVPAIHAEPPVQITTGTTPVAPLGIYRSSLWPLLVAGSGGA